MRQCCLNHEILLWLIFLIFFAAYSSADILVFSTIGRQIEEEFRDMPAKFGGIISPEGIKVCCWICFIINYIYVISYSRVFSFFNFLNPRIILEFNVYVLENSLGISGLIWNFYYSLWYLWWDDYKWKSCK